MNIKKISEWTKDDVRDFLTENDFCSQIEKDLESSDSVISFIQNMSGSDWYYFLRHRPEFEKYRKNR